MRKPVISVVIPSRNRPALLFRAIESVFSQTFKNFEIIVVNDGSDEKFLPEYEGLPKKYGRKLKIINLVHYSRGHGPSYVINTGVSQSVGEICTFLDDDDYWIDTEHLQKMLDAFTRFEESDLYLANQVAVEFAKQEGKVLWLGQLEALVARVGLLREKRVYQVDVNLLMKIDGFSHLNTTAVRRGLFDRIGGLDENIRWEGDHDFYLRLIDASRGILFNPDIVAQHNIPDKTKLDNITTATSFYQRMNSQLYMLNKNALSASHGLIVKRARQHKVYALKRIVEQLLLEKRYDDAIYFSSQALGMDASWKWWIYHTGLLFQRLFKK